MSEEPHASFCLVFRAIDGADTQDRPRTHDPGHCRGAFPCRSVGANSTRSKIARSKHRSKSFQARKGRPKPNAEGGFSPRSSILDLNMLYDDTLHGDRRSAVARSVAVLRPAWSSRIRKEAYPRHTLLLGQANGMVG